MLKFIIFPVTLLFSIACKKSTSLNSSVLPQAPKPINVDAYIVTPVSFDEVIKLPGNILPAEQAELYSEVNGIVENVYFKDGQEVSNGQLLLSLNDGELQARLAKLKVQEEILSIEEKRQLELLKVNAIGKSEYDNSLLQYKSILADIQIAKAELRKYSIVAPFSGVLGMRMVSKGDFLNSSMMVTTLTKIIPLKILFSIPEKYSNRIQKNQKITFTSEIITSSQTAVIQFISPYMNAQSKNLEVIAEVMHPDKNLKSGQFAMVQLDLAKKEKAILIPSQCIIPRIKDKQVALYKSGKVAFSTVELAYRDSSRVEIISGIKVGDTLLTTGIMKLKPGMAVTLNNLTPIQ